MNCFFSLLIVEPAKVIKSTSYFFFQKDPVTLPRDGSSLMLVLAAMGEDEEAAAAAATAAADGKTVGMPGNTVG